MNLPGLLPAHTDSSQLFSSETEKQRERKKRGDWERKFKKLEKDEEADQPCHPKNSNSRSPSWSVQFPFPVVLHSGLQREFAKRCRPVSITLTATPCTYPFRNYIYIINKKMGINIHSWFFDVILNSGRVCGYWLWMTSSENWEVIIIWPRPRFPGMFAIFPILYTPYLTFLSWLEESIHLLLLNDMNINETKSIETEISIWCNIIMYVYLVQMNKNGREEMIYYVFQFIRIYYIVI